MRRTLGLAALSLAGLALLDGGHAAQLVTIVARPPVLVQTPARAASVTDPALAPAITAPTSPRGHGESWTQSAADTSGVAQRPLDDDVLAAYFEAVAASPSDCHLPVSLLMAIGQVESGNLAGHPIDASHRATPPILGPALDGTPWRAVPDTDAGRLDGDNRWDRAVGPMQFIPASWRVAGVDMDGDGQRDPQDIYDAAGATMVYLCAGSRDLATPAGLRDAVLGFNHSAAYLQLVLRWKQAFDTTTDTASPWSTATFLGGPGTGPGAAPDAAVARNSRRPADKTPADAMASPPGNVHGLSPVAPPSRPLPAPGPVSPPHSTPDPTPPSSDSPTPAPPQPEPTTPAPDPVTEPPPTPTELPPCPTPTVSATPEVVDPPVIDPIDPATCLPVPTPSATETTGQPPSPAGG